MIFRTINNWCAKRIESFCPQQTTFGIFFVLSYVFPFFMWSPVSDYNYRDPALHLRILSGVLCVVLILREVIPGLMRNIFPIYWYITLFICLPFNTTYLLLLNHASTLWLVNMALMIFLLATLVDWLSFSIILVLGSVGGYGFYILVNGNNHVIEFNDTVGFLIFYIAFFAILIGLIFSRNREYIHKRVLEILDRKIAEHTSHLERALTLKTEFVNNLSHEVRIPIQCVMGFSESLLQDWKYWTEEQKHDLAQKVHSSAKRLLYLVDSMLDIAKLDAGMMKLNIKHHDLNEIIQRVMQDHQAIYMHKQGVEIDFIPDKAHSELECDDLRLYQVISNLLVNAIKFTAKGKITLRSSEQNYIHPKTRAIVEGVKFTISDQGIGIPDHELQEIFNPFSQSSLTKTKAGGTGLGLSIARQMVAAHYGRIWAWNNENGGASFSFIIPKYYVPTDSEEVSEEGTLLEKNTENQLSKVSLPGRDDFWEQNDSVEDTSFKRILFIDDEKSCQEVMQFMLYRSNYKIIYAASGGKEGLEYLEDNYQNVDIILLDMMMPDMYGLEVLEKIHQDERFKNIPVILQTGIADKMDMKKAMELGVANCLNKPYSRDEVIKAIERAETNISICPLS